MNQERLSLRRTLFKVVIALVSAPLILGGLIVAGEEGDPRIFIYGTVFLCLGGATLITKHLSAIRLAVPHEAQSADSP